MRQHTKTHPIKPRAYRVNDFCQAYGFGRTKVYEMIKSGELKSIRVGGCRLIPADEAEALLKSEAA